MQCLHGVPAVLPEVATGVKEIGRLRTISGDIADLVLTPQARKRQGAIVLRRRDRGTLPDVAIRQLALGMFDGEPVARACSAYAYWQATRADHVAVPILEACLETEDEEAFTVAAHCMAHVKPTRLKPYVGTAADDKPNSPTRRMRRSMTVIVHGTFARNQSWYQPGGDFHSYIKEHVYPDVYAGNDFFRWSGRYSDPARKTAARKLKHWCETHPTRKLRLIGHSHGANVINLATSRGLPACTLILLSPPVRDEYLPDMSQVSSGKIFNIHSRFDLVVSLLDGSRQSYKNTTVAAHESPRICALRGHSKSHEPKRWRKKNIPRLVRSVC
jgi:predicted esterase